MPEGSSIWVVTQTVLYNNKGDEIERYVRSFARAVRNARSLFPDMNIKLVFGDCSEASVLNHESLEHLQTLLLDDSIAFAYEIFSENLGSARAHNRLFFESNPAQECDVVIIANPDIYFGPFSILELLSTLSDQSIGMAEARQIPYQHPKSWNLDTGDTSWAATACAAIKGYLFVELGGFDDSSFFLYCDDVDFSWRLRLAGHRVVFVPSASVFHDKRLSLDAMPKPSSAERYYSIEASLMMTWKYSRDDLLDKYLEMCKVSEHEDFKRAYIWFMKRFNDRSLPDRLDEQGKVAEFRGDDYAVHLFTYGN